MYLCPVNRCYHCDTQGTQDTRGFLPTLLQITFSKDVWSYLSSSLLLICIYPVYLVYLVYISNINKLTTQGQHRLHRVCLKFALDWDAVLLLKESAALFVGRKLKVPDPIGLADNWLAWKQSI